ncbi:hypothetical protein BY996DRAFT_4590347 [Phakopsora pachyrhizi]|uniref:18S rRNA factor 2 n=1 Tax=Phakopsora pachyrhizi TaxID=170000 RepID=A0AAV0B791_PHAPC|nr:hypothetical protein BY996DRAFT_4590347 [Phakopsora pachyrhizi]CAH7681237.1 hypothetical protein PPACK8108_LOCUS13812 [Phakopsora pachyrhizi]
MISERAQDDDNQKEQCKSGSTTSCQSEKSYLVDLENDRSHGEIVSDDDQSLNLESNQNSNYQKVIDLKEISKLEKKIDRTGLIYVARIPPGMGPGKLKHLLSRWGSINRVYLARDEESKNNEKLSRKRNSKRKNLRQKHQSYDFKEGWVEFEDKKVARRVAEMLNTRPIGGKPSDRFYSDLWSLTYLPRFKWSRLSDQIATERRMKEQLQRNSLEDSKKSQDWYLRMVEKGKVNEKIRAKEISRKGKLVNPDKWKKDFRQRDIEVNEQSDRKSVLKAEDPKLKSVLSQLL